MAFPQHFLDELTRRTDIVDVVGEYVHLVRKGGSYWACCPFHNERTPSFKVDQTKQLFYCFGCKKGGDTISFLMEMERLSYPETVRVLAKRAGLEVPEEDARDREAARQRARLLALNRDAARFYHQRLQSPAGDAVRAYLTRRQIRWKTAVRFGMGAASDDWDALLLAMTEKGYRKEELLSVGLVIEGKGGHIYDRFRNRLMLPVVDIRGEVVAFGSRVLDHSEPRYMNSPDTPVYSKREVLYGLNLAKKSKRPNLILCEGNLDVVTLHQAGFDNAVASMGTALTQEQIQLITRLGCRELILCYDNDRAGETAAEKALTLLNRSSLQVRVLRLPQRQTESGELVKQDPDDYIKYHGPDAFAQLLHGSQNGMEFRMAQLAGKYDLTEAPARAAYCQEAAALIAALDSPAERDIYTSRAAETANVHENVMAQEVARAAKKQLSEARRLQQRKALQPLRSTQPAVRTLQYANVRSARAEEGILRLLLLDDSIFPPPDEPPLQKEQFSSELLGRACQILWEARAEQRPLSPAVLSGHFTSEEMSQLAAVCQQPESQEHRARALADYIATIREEFRRRTESDPLQAAQERNRKKKKGGTQT